MFEGVKYVSEPVVQIAIEPKHPKDLPKLVDILRQLTIEDPNLVVKIDEESQVRQLLQEWVCYTWMLQYIEFRMQNVKL